MSKKFKKSEQAWTSTTGVPKWNQSPVDLNKMYLLHQRFSPIYLEGHTDDAAKYTISNTGTTVRIVFEGEDKPVVRGGPLAGEYQFYEMQFRWGETDARGAEHSIDGVWFSMEAQAMHWNKSYGSIEKCYEKTDGIVGISYLLQVTGCPEMAHNPNFSLITDNLREVRFPGNSKQLPQGSLNWMDDACPKFGYYTYHGSLTTPPYPECVNWIVVPQSIKISKFQAEAFRNVYDNKGDRIISNYRQDQKIHDRKVFLALEGLRKRIQKSSISKKIEFKIDQLNARTKSEIRLNPVAFSPNVRQLMSLRMVVQDVKQLIKILRCTEDTLQL